MIEDVRQLRELSCRLGADRMLVQAGGGNTSVKTSEGLWVKASGTRLADGFKENTFLFCDWTLLTAWQRGDTESLEVTQPDGETLRASVETAMHLALPHRYVAHLHSVRAISLLIQVDANPIIEERMAGIRWQRVGYVHPGKILAEEIQSSLQGRTVDVLLLDNHGIVVGADNAPRLESLIREVEERLETQPRWTSQGTEQVPRESTLAGWRRVPGLASQLAHDHEGLRRAAGGTLYPDHCVYLGPSITAAPNMDAVPRAFEQYRSRYKTDPKSLVIADDGAYLPNRAKPAAEEMLVCLADVISRTPSESTLQYLTEDAVQRLVQWDAEEYRLAVEARSQGEETKGR